MEVQPGVYRITTCYPDFEKIPLALHLVRGRERTALIDAAIPASVERDIVPFLARLGLRPTDLDMVLVTHGHPDHVGGLAALRELHPGLEIICPATERPWVEDQAKMFDELFCRFPGDLDFTDDVRRYVLDELSGPAVQVTSTAAPGDRVDLGGVELTWVDAPGHSLGHMALLDEARGIVFVADASQGRGVAHSAASIALPPLYEDDALYLKTQRRLRDIGARLLLSAHHEIQEKEQVDRFLELSEAFVRRSADMVREILDTTPGGVTTGQVAMELKSRLDRLETQDYQGPLQLLLAADSHLKALQSDHAARMESGTWVAA